MLYAIQNCATEWSLRSGRRYADPFHEAVVEVEVTCPDGASQRVPAFWAGEDTWRVRYASSQVGTHTFRTRCSDASNPDLHGQEGELTVTAYDGGNPLF